MLHSLPTSMVTQRTTMSMRTMSRTTTIKVGARDTIARARMAAMGIGTMLTGSNNSSIMIAMIHNGARMTTICGDLVEAVLFKTFHGLPQCVRSGEDVRSLAMVRGEAGKQILPYKTNNTCIQAQEFVGNV